jgi:hypothetical protein
MEPSPASIAGKRGTDLGPAIGALLPTPAAGNFNDGESLESWQARNERLRDLGINGNGMGTPLPVAVQLLKTPTAQLAVNGGSQHPDKRREGGHGPTLADQVEHELLPASAARDWRSGKSNLMDHNARPLNEVVVNLLPTPNATDGQGGNRAVPERRTSQGKDHGPRLRDVAPTLLLPTPRATDGTKWGPGQTATGSLAKDLLLHGVLTRLPSAGGKPSSAGQHPGQLSLDEPAAD